MGTILASARKEMLMQMHSTPYRNTPVFHFFATNSILFRAAYVCPTANLLMGDIDPHLKKLPPPQLTLGSHTRPDRQCTVLCSMQSMGKNIK